MCQLLSILNIVGSIETSDEQNRLWILLMCITFREAAVATGLSKQRQCVLPWVDDVWLSDIYLYPELDGHQLQGVLKAFHLSTRNAVMTDWITVRGIYYANDMLVILSCEVGLIVCIVVKQPTTLLILRWKNPDHGVFKVEDEEGLICTTLD